MFGIKSGQIVVHGSFHTSDLLLILLFRDESYSLVIPTVYGLESTVD